MRSSLVALVMLCACKIPPAGPSPGDAPANVQERGDPELEAIAAKIDPGPQRPLSEDMPAWLKSKVDAQLSGDPASAAAVSEAREAIAAWDKLKAGDTGALLVGALTVARGLVLAERAVAAGSDDPELLAALSKAYRLVEQLGFFQNNQLFSQVIQLGVQFAQKEGGLVGQQVEEGLGLLKTAIARAPALHMHTAARVLREHPRHPTIPEVLLRLSQAEQSAERFPEAKQLRTLAVARKGERATAGDFLGLADTCYRALDRACGDMAKKTAAERGPDEQGPEKAQAFAKRLEELALMATRVDRVAELQSEGGLVRPLERAKLLLLLGRTSDAEALFGALRKQYPDDARPATGLAMAAANRAGDFVRAAALIREARTLAGRDLDYYEVALGTVPVVVMTDVVAQMAKNPDGMPSLDAAVAEVSGLVEEYRAFDPARAAVLSVALTAAKQAAPKFMAKDPAGGMAIVRALPGQATALARQFPRSKDVWRLVYTTSRLAGTVEEAQAMVTQALPPELEKDPELRLIQARTLVDLAVQWESSPLMNRAVEAAASMPEGTDVDATRWLRATVDAQVGRLGDKAALQRADEAFRELAGRLTGGDRALAYNNLGVLAATGGDAQGAINFFEEALKADGEMLAPRLNTGAVALLVGSYEHLNELFDSAKTAKLATFRLHAYAYMVALADAGMGDVAVTRKEFQEALVREREGEFRGAVPLGGWGVAPTGEIKLSFGYSTSTGLVLTDEVVSQWWLFVPAPTFEGLLAADKGQAKPGAKQEKKREKKTTTKTPAKG